MIVIGVIVIEWINLWFVYNFFMLKINIICDKDDEFLDLFN